MALRFKDLGQENDQDLWSPKKSATPQLKGTQMEGHMKPTTSTPQQRLRQRQLALEKQRSAARHCEIRFLPQSISQCYFFLNGPDCDDFSFYERDHKYLEFP